jgi:hypothetical protein
MLEASSAASSARSSAASSSMSYLKMFSNFVDLERTGWNLLKRENELILAV